MFENNTETYLLPFTEDDHTGIDVENFLHTLSYREHVVMLMRYFDFPNQEIGDVLHIHPSGIYPILNEVRKKVKEGL